MIAISMIAFCFAMAGAFLYSTPEVKLLVAEIRGPESLIKTCTSIGGSICRDHSRNIFIFDRCEAHVLYWCGERIYHNRQITHSLLKRTVIDYCHGR